MADPGSPRGGDREQERLFGPGGGAASGADSRPAPGGPQRGAPTGPTPTGGENEKAPSGVDLARVALRAARQRARERGAGRTRQSRTPALRSGARPGGRDPLKLGAAFDRLKTERGWEMPIAVGGVSGRWPEVVGPEIAQHCEPEGYDERERVLTVRCDSTAWATQLRILAPQLLVRLNGELGSGTVRLLKVKGPSGPPRTPGQWRAPGSRGPGDTYG